MDLLARILGRYRRPEPTPPRAAADDPVARWRTALDAYGFPYRTVADHEATEVFEAEERLGEREGFTPVFIAPGHWNPVRTPATKRVRSARRQIGAGISPEKGRAFLARRFAQFAACRSDDPEALDAAVFDALDEVPPRSSVSGLFLLKRHDFATGRLEPQPEIAVMRIPTNQRHTIPLYLDWGGWNAVPSSYELAAVACHWERTDGARLVAIGSDAFEFTVARRPASHAEAVALLKEHYVVAESPDDKEGLEEVAAELRVSDTWFFWWD